jgi:hydroxyacylglutathione hydrolase
MQKNAEICSMLKVQSFTFNPFAENTYIVYDEMCNCAIFDPGMYNASEQMELVQFIEKHQLKPQYLINTHCHIDHIMSNTFISEKYNLKLMAHQNEVQILSMGKASAAMYGLSYHLSVEITQFIDERDVIILGNDALEIRFVPGHSPGSLCFYSATGQFVVSGDALFQQSIGRTDLPGGDHSTLIGSIKSELMSLPDETIVFSGHGPETSIGDERVNNPFL